MAISGVSNNSNTQVTTSSGATQSLMSNYETFLTLLTTQLKYQSPLDPLDTNQFTQQLVQYSQVEQSIKTNDYLESLIAATKATTNLVGYIGTQVSAEGATTILKNGEANWYVTAASNATAKISITNSAGVVVHEQELDLSKGANLIQWDGLVDGVESPDGAYTISVSAKDANGSVVTTSTKIAGIVTGIDMTGDEPALKIGDVTIPLSSVREVSVASVPEDPDEGSETPDEDTETPEA